MLDSQNITISVNQLQEIISNAVEAGLNKFAIENGMKKEYYSQKEAYNRFGRWTVDRWRMEGKVKAVKQKGIIKFKVVELEKQSNEIELYNQVND